MTAPEIDVDDLRAISVSGPWHWPIVRGLKTIENRTWRVSEKLWNRRVAIHAAKSWDKDGVAAIQKAMEYIDGPLARAHDMPPLHRGSYAHSCIVGVATLVSVVDAVDVLALPESDRVWFSGPQGWVLRDAVKLVNPVAATGRLGLWPVPRRMAAMVKESMPS